MPILLIIALVIGAVFVKSDLVHIQLDEPTNATVQGIQNEVEPSKAPEQLPTYKPSSGAKTTPQAKTQQVVVNQPTLTPDPDPIVTCKSKTGDIQVRKSVCSSYTDCPDGSGGYIFESQDSCKKRWKKLNQELLKLNDEFINAMRESNKLSKELFDLNLQKAQTDLDTRLNEVRTTTENLPEFVPPSPSSNIKIEEPTPKPKPNYEGTDVRNFGW